jgi:hypothetical protein
MAERLEMAALDERGRSLIPTRIEGTAGSETELAAKRAVKAKWRTADNGLRRGESSTVEGVSFRVIRRARR